MKIRQYNFLFDLYFLFFLLPKYEATKEDIKELGFAQDVIEKGADSKAKYNPHRWLMKFIERRVVLKRKKLIIQESPY